MLSTIRGKKRVITMSPLVWIATYRMILYRNISQRVKTVFSIRKGFTFQDFHEPIMIKSKNSRILQESCLYCHEAMVMNLVLGAKTDQDAVRCVHCHQSVGHGEPAGLGGPEREDYRERG